MITLADASTTIDLEDLLTDPVFILFAPVGVIIAVLLIYLWMKYGD